MSSYTTCPICRQHIEPDAPGSGLAERREDRPGFGQKHDYVWGRVGYAHERGLVGARGHRPASE